MPLFGERLYIDQTERWAFYIWDKLEHIENPTIEDKINLLKGDSPYRKCIYKCDNDVVDHQTVNLLFEDDVTVTFTMSAFTLGGRHIHIMGTKGEIRAEITDESPIDVFDFKTRETKRYSLVGGNDITGGHGGGDYGLIHTLYDYLTDNYTGNAISGAEISCENHLTVFAAEKSRLFGGMTIDMDEYIKSLDK